MVARCSGDDVLPGRRRGDHRQPFSFRCREGNRERPLRDADNLPEPALFRLGDGALVSVWPFEQNDGDF